MSKYSSVAVRFAPSPTGLMHLGSARTALMNYLFAQKYAGEFIIRIEDTDPARNFDPQAKKIIEDILWLGLNYTQGPIKGGPYAPYFQSERTPLYQEKFSVLQENGFVYRCFCTIEDLEKKRLRQEALKLPPRYDRTCAFLSPEEIEEKLREKVPFIWRFKLDLEKMIGFEDLARGNMIFELKNFSDFSITRPDGSFTFMFANCIDDMVMNITHVLRGEDHLTNTVCQVALYHAFGFTAPKFWHLPVISNKDGKKLSKRDFGFSLTDLKNAGFLPEAICNYLAIIGGGTFTQEILSLEELVQQFDFEHIKSTGQVRYDVEKLRWVNHQWIERLPLQELAQRCLPFLKQEYPAIASRSPEKIEQLITQIKSEMVTLTDSVELLRFYFEQPVIDSLILKEIKNVPAIKELIQKHLPVIEKSGEDFVNTLKSECKQNNIPLKEMFSFIRCALTGKPHGLAIHDLIAMLGAKESKNRLMTAGQLR